MFPFTKVNSASTVLDEFYNGWVVGMDVGKRLMKKWTDN